MARPLPPRATTNIGRWYCLLKEDGTLHEEYAYLLIDVDMAWHPRAYYVRRWPGKNDTASAVETSVPLRSWAWIETRSRMMPEDWSPAWWGVIPDGPSLQRAREAGRL